MIALVIGSQVQLLATPGIRRNDLALSDPFGIQAESDVASMKRMPVQAAYRFCKEASIGTRTPGMRATER
jgi:hypothetical protein